MPAPIESLLLAVPRSRQGATTREVSDELLEALSDAYAEAAGGHLET